MKSCNFQIIDLKRKRVLILLHHQERALLLNNLNLPNNNWILTCKSITHSIMISRQDWSLSKISLNGKTLLITSMLIASPVQVPEPQVFGRQLLISLLTENSLMNTGFQINPTWQPLWIKFISQLLMPKSTRLNIARWITQSKDSTQNTMIWFWLNWSPCNKLLVHSVLSHKKVVNPLYWVKLKAQMSIKEWSSLDWWKDF